MSNGPRDPRYPSTHVAEGREFRSLQDYEAYKAGQLGLREVVTPFGMRPAKWRKAFSQGLSFKNLTERRPG